MKTTNKNIKKLLKRRSELSSIIKINEADLKRHKYLKSMVEREIESEIAKSHKDKR